MNDFERHLRAAVNPVSTAVTRWWCHSAWRHRLTGYGPAARPRRRRREDMIRAAGSAPAGPMTARREAIDELLGPEDHGR